MRCKPQLFSAVVLLCTSFLFACNSDDGGTQTAVTLDAGDASVRQIMALGDNPLKVIITVNSSGQQVFLLDASASELSVDLADVRIGQSNEIVVTWIEIINGFDVEISRQRHSFVAENRVVIDSEHRHWIFDYDSDGVSNFDERLGDTCVWRLDDNCDLDVPENNSLLLNGDFSTGAQHWDGIFFDGVADGEICIRSSTEAVFEETSYLIYLQPLSLQTGVTYTALADVRSEFPATPQFAFVRADDFITLHSKVFSASSTTTTASTTFVAGSDQPNVHFSIQFGDGTANRYCIDNVRVLASEI